VDGAASVAEAIDAAAAGRYLPALVIADRLHGHPDAGIRSAAAALQGSILRQLHQHVEAQAWDERALANAVGGPTSETRLDALVGLVADAVGQGLVEVAEHRWSVLVGLLGEATPRLRVRGGWVGAEVSLLRGDYAQAVGWARSAVDIAGGVSQRHRAKSLLLLGVCLHGAGWPDEAVAEVRSAAVLAARRRLRPLLWPSAYVLSTWVSGPEASRWRDWASLVVESIARELPEAMASRWMSDPAAADLLAHRR
jgi:hypothetical protein